ncbi:hypothetical protein QE363_001993 [Sphingomonas sp. SORGH_AS870]|uniref:avidin/streptavidin family protein n=1 Tax=Sphingomonas sp. SORGH_AS_0870 TaxID=3041801 RepID=UPI00285B0CA1|nr:avidin/streptavidin family protein [Sphingomonas sp. SORGH_AS_0870]MDR6146200.1 hypothetical protein [Sphingomonas sp. SORGH_AS_0870]
MSVRGTWTNDYGSTMELAQTADGQVYGTYKSHTGSTGTYVVYGACDPTEPTSSAGQAVALTICWHSTDPGPGDASWHWASGLGGQVALNNGQPTLLLNHAMIATLDLDGIVVGNYIDKLTYLPKADASDGPSELMKWLHEQMAETGTELSDPVDGRWKSSDGTLLEMSVRPVIGPKGDRLFGFVTGNANQGGVTSPLLGVTDINIADVDLQSVAVAFFDRGQKAATAFAGSRSKASDQISFVGFVSEGVGYNARYAQTRVSGPLFVRGS